MKSLKSWLPVIVRNLLGMAALVLIHYVSDRYALPGRTGFRQFSPYLFLISLYAWIVFHNRVLFDRLYRSGKKAAYFFWLFAGMGLCSANLIIILVFVFNVSDVWPQVLSFWVYTAAGLGVFTFYLYVGGTPAFQNGASPIAAEVGESGFFDCVIDGQTKQIPLTSIVFLESYENYIKVNLEKQVLLTRLSMKEAEERLPKSSFLRISRSHIINVRLNVTVDAETVTINGTALKIGKTYKRYVVEAMGGRVKGRSNG